MDQALSTSAEKFQKFIRTRNPIFRVRELSDSTRTADEAAKAIGCGVAEIAKSMVFKTEEGKALLVIASGVNHVDEKKLKKLSGFRVKRADPDFVKEQTGYSIGGVPPLGHRKSVKTFMDEDLLQYQEIWAAAGSPHAVFPVEPGRLVEWSGAVVAEIKKIKGT